MSRSACHASIRPRAALLAALALAAPAALRAQTPSPTPSPSPSATPAIVTPYFLFDPVSQIANVGQDIEFIAEVSQIAPSSIQKSLFYTWEKDGSFRDGGSTPVLAITGVAASDQGTYNCTAHGDLGDSTSKDATLTVNDPAAPNSAILLFDDAPVQMATGATRTLSVAICNTSVVTWSQKQGYDLAVTSDPSGLFQGAAKIAFSSPKIVVAASGGTYTFMAQIKAPGLPGQATATLQMEERGATFGPAIQIQIDIVTPTPSATPSATPSPSQSSSQTPSPTASPSPTPPVIILDPVSQAANKGQNVEFHGLADEGPGASPIGVAYQWLKDGSEITSATAPTLSLLSVQSKDEADYRLSASNLFGASLSASAHLTVYDPPHANAAELVKTTAPATMFVGQGLYVGISMRNSSDLTWSAPQGYSMAVESDADGLLGGAARLGFLDPDAVVPAGAFTTFIAYLQAPGSPGSYSAGLQMIEEGVEAFGPIVTISIEAIERPNFARDWSVYE